MPFAVENTSAVSCAVVCGPGTRLIGALFTPSRLITDTSAGSSPLYAGSALVAAASTMLYGTFPSVTRSNTPVMVTVRATFQSVVVKVSTPGVTVPSVASLEASAMVTFAVGAVLSTTEKVAVPPSSVVVSPEVGVTVMPGPYGGGNYVE